MFACCCLDSNARKRVLSFGCNNFHSTIINVLLLSGSAMVMFENHQSYDDAVNAKSAKLRSRDLMKTVSDMTETMASASDSELLVYFSAKLLELQSAMLVARSDVTPWYNHVFNHVSDRAPPPRPWLDIRPVLPPSLAPLALQRPPPPPHRTACASSCKV